MNRFLNEVCLWIGYFVLLLVVSWLGFQAGMWITQLGR